MTIEQLFRTRILILDGAMGTMIQTFKLDEAAYGDVSRITRWILKATMIC